MNILLETIWKAIFCGLKGMWRWRRLHAGFLSYSSLYRIRCCFHRTSSTYSAFYRVHLFESHLCSICIRGLLAMRNIVRLLTSVATSRADLLQFISFLSASTTDLRFSFSCSSLLRRFCSFAASFFIGRGMLMVRYNPCAVQYRYCRGSSIV